MAGLRVVCKAQPSVGANARAGASPALGLGEHARSPRALKRTQARARARTTCNTNEPHIASAPWTVIAREVAFWREKLDVPRCDANSLQKWPGVFLDLRNLQSSPPSSLNTYYRRLAVKHEKRNRRAQLAGLRAAGDQRTGHRNRNLTWHTIVLRGSARIQVQSMIEIPALNLRRSDTSREHDYTIML